MIISYFETLKLFGLEPGFTDDQLKTAYRRMAHKYHPDKGGNPQDFKNISAARDFLLKNRPGVQESAQPKMNVQSHHGGFTITYKFF